MLIDLKKFVADIPSADMTVEFWASSVEDARQKMDKLGVEYELTIQEDDDE